MKKLIEDFKKARLALIQALDSFPKEKREEVLFGEWTLKDLVAHLSGWNIAGAKAVRSLKQGKVPPWAGKISEFNKLNVRKRKNWSWEKTYQELLKASKEFIEEYENLPEELWEKRYWPKKDYTPKKILMIELKHYRETHLPQILKFKQKSQSSQS